MAKKARNRRSGRQARQRERLEGLQSKVDAGVATDEEAEQLEELRAAAVAVDAKADEAGDDLVGEDPEAIARANEAADKEEKGAQEDGKGAVKKAKSSPTQRSPLVRYLKGVRLEMRRVTWPTRQELAKYSVSTIAMLLLTGASVWAIDNGFISAIIAFSGLRP